MEIDPTSYAQRATDLKRLSKLEAAPTPPTAEEKTRLCCLYMRYGDDSAFSDRVGGLIHEWDHSPSTLLDECREIWLSGFRPTDTDYGVGSANDTQEDQ